MRSQKNSEFIGELAGTPFKWDEAQAQVASLTARQREVLALLARGESNKSIARALGVSPRTVEIHRSRLMDRLGVGTSADAVRIAIHAALAEAYES